MGDADAAWICAATLDRYLQSIGQKQIFGTQYRTGHDHRETMDPYDRNLVSDAVRKQLGVPSQSAQLDPLKADLNPK